jgi:glycosyltransferase involved in cell wall biosynthesis
MTPVFGEGTELKSSEVEGHIEPHPPAPLDPSRPGVFLMINSLETGGSERQFAELVRSLDQTSFRLHLGCLQKRGTFLDPAGMEHFRVRGSLYRWQSIKSRYRVARHMRRENIAIAHAFDFYTNLMLIPAARLARIPVVIGSLRQLGDLLTPLQYRVQAAMFRLSDCVVCNSRAAADRLLRAGVPEHKVVVIANGLPPEAFAETQPALPRRTGVTRIGMIARMNLRAKNHHVFLAAAARVLARFPNAEFVLAGDGPLRPELEATARQLELGDRVHFLGDRRDIPAILASLDVSVLPSASESLSNVIIESMAAGVPVVANRVGGNPELVTERTGILVPPDDVDALAAGIERLLSDAGLRVQLGRNARQFATSHFTNEQMRTRHEELYRELLEKKRWKPKLVASSVSGSAATTRRMRVAIVAASLRYVGGQSVQADLLVQNCLHDPDLRAKLVPIDPALPRAISWVERVPVLRTIVREPFYLWSLWRELKDVDIAHIFSASYWSFLIAPLPALLMARLRGKKALVHYHSGEARDHLRRFRTARPLLAKADLLVVPSGYLVDVFREFGLDALAVPNIIDLSQFTFRLRRPVRPHLVCTRGFHPYYCVDVVVKAFAEVQKTYPEARLDLVGNGPLESELRQLAQELQPPNVEFTGVASRGEIARFYDRADIFINASRLDNMPVSVLEAFASGTPVVSTAPEGMRYVVEHERTGLLSEPGDVHTLAQNVLRLLKDPELAANLACNAHEESRRYRWAAVRQQWLEVYRSLMPRAQV